MRENAQMARPKFCGECGARLAAEGGFCHSCGSPINGSEQENLPSLPPALKWVVPAIAVLALIVVVFFRIGQKTASNTQSGAPPAAGSAGAMPDIATMSPQERANRLFNRVMTYASEGKKDSAAFFAPMALASIEAVTPLTVHSRYDMGLVDLVSGDVNGAKAQADAILADRPTHLLGLLLSARVADEQGDTTQARRFRRRFLSLEKTERAAGLPEYADHDADIVAAAGSARRKN